MGQKRLLAQRALTEALKIRDRENIKINQPLNPIDLAEGLGIKVLFVDLSSLEAMYTKKDDEPIILISALRPPGRQSFSCAHELGHHIFNHGTKIDELFENDLIGKTKKFDPEEYIADRFASFLLMPKSLVSYGFTSRKLSPEESKPKDFYLIAGWLGVGYSTLINQMRFSLNLISTKQYNTLIKISPQKIRSEIIGHRLKENLVIVDSNWTGRAIDIRVGDLILSPPNTATNSSCVQVVEQKQTAFLYRGIRPGIGRLHCTDESWAAYIRVSRKNYSGRSKFRHLEDPEYE